MKIYFVSLSRSDYASLAPVAKAALKDPAIDAKIIAGGSHLLKRFGHTIRQIKKDGLPIHARADFLSEKDDTPRQLAKAYAKAVAQFVRIFCHGQPDMVFLVGDRWEMLAVASAASMLNIPIAHHSGGDITQGSADNQTRYALTCLSHLHLVALPEHRLRLMQMGEEPWRITVTGEPALTGLAHHGAGQGVQPQLGLKAGEAFALATFHPTSFESLPPDRQIEVFLRALESITLPIVLTAPNPDAASGLFLHKLKDYAHAHPRIKLHESLGAELYYAAMRQASLMIGNSSSGLWEAPSFKLPVVNIGLRQQGRVHGDNVVHAALEERAIEAAIRQALDPAFRARLSGANPYVRPDTLELILACLKHPYDKAELLAKRFVDPLHAPHSSR